MDDNLKPKSEETNLMGQLEKHIGPLKPLQGDHDASSLKEALKALDIRLDQKDFELKNVVKELDLFLYRASHDLRRPIAAVMALVDLSKQTDSEEEKELYLEKIGETAQQFDRVMTKFRMVSDIRDNELLLTNIPVQKIFKIIQGHLKRYLVLDEVQMQLQFEETAPLVSNDTLFYAILYNLIENAIQYRREQGAQVKIHVISSIQSVRIRVEDNGVGIPYEIQKNVFEMFYRGDERSNGSGLGLYIVRKAVKRLGGLIRLSSTEERQNTTVDIHLPNVRLTTN